MSENGVDGRGNGARVARNGSGSGRARARNPRVAIVGAGMSGLCMGVKLKRAGFDDFTIYEKADQLGGTWRENTYPGLTCDVPSSYYNFSFDPNPDWSGYFPPGDEIWSYFEAVADRYGLRQHIRFGERVASARFEDGRWHLSTEGGGEETYDFLVAASGFLHHPSWPEIEGLESFAGTTLHSAEWDHDVEVAGRRVGIIGTGSTGVQIAAALADVAGRLEIFQRTAQWILPMPYLRYSRVGRAVRRRFRGLNRLRYLVYQRVWERTFGRALVHTGWQRRLVSWLCRAHLIRVRDPELRRQLTPDYEPGCKRLVVNWHFYSAVQRSNVDVVTESIDRIEPRGVVTDDGVLHELDVLVLATGFDPHAFMRPMELVGERGRTLEQAWDPDPRAYRTVALPDFPNFFMLVGPHSPFGHQSVITISETQADYVMSWIERFAAGEVDSMAPTEEATASFNADVRRALPHTVWMTGGCQSWYMSSDGYPELWPWTVEYHREMLAEPQMDHFEVRRPAARTAS